LRTSGHGVVLYHRGYMATLWAIRLGERNNQLQDGNLSTNQ
jgi:hypothetical protein